MTPRRRSSVAWRAFALATSLWIAGSVMADDVDPLDRQLLDALEGRPPADSPLEIVPRLIGGTKTTAQRLKAGLLDAETAALQDQILADIDALLKQSSPPDRLPSGSPSPSSQPPQDSSNQQQDQSPQDSQNQQDADSDPNATSKESQQRSTPGEDRGVVQNSRLGLSSSAWGHLPPKVREQMRSAFSEEYLPEYDALVRRYYEALARRRSAERDRFEAK